MGSSKNVDNWLSNMEHGKQQQQQQHIPSWTKIKPKKKIPKEIMLVKKYHPPPVEITFKHFTHHTAYIIIHNESIRN